MSLLDKKFIALALGLPDTTDDAAVTTAFQTLINEHRTFKADNISLSAKVKAIEVTRNESLIQLAVDKGKITLAQKPTYLKLAEKDFDSTKELLDGIPAVVNLAAAAPASPTTIVAGEDRSKWTFNDWSMKDEKGLQLMQSTDFPSFETLYEKQFGSKPSK